MGLQGRVHNLPHTTKVHDICTAYGSKVRNLAETRVSLISDLLRASVPLSILPILLPSILRLNLYHHCIGLACLSGVPGPPKHTESSWPLFHISFTLVVTSAAFTNCHLNIYDVLLWVSVCLRRLLCERLEPQLLLQLL